MADCFVDCQRKVVYCPVCKAEAGLPLPAEISILAEFLLSFRRKHRDCHPKWADVRMEMGLPAKPRMPVVDQGQLDAMVERSREQFKHLAKDTP